MSATKHDGVKELTIRKISEKFGEFLIDFKIVFIEIFFDSVSEARTGKESDAVGGAFGECLRAFGFDSAGGGEDENIFCSRINGKFNGRFGANKS